MENALKPLRNAGRAAKTAFEKIQKSRPDIGNGQIA